MKWFRFSQFVPQPRSRKELASQNLLHIFPPTSSTKYRGDVAEALSCWLTSISAYKYDQLRIMGLWLYRGLKSQGYMTEENQKGAFKSTGKAEADNDFEVSFGEDFCKLKRSKIGVNTKPLHFLVKRRAETEPAVNTNFGDNLDPKCTDRFAAILISSRTLRD